MRDALTAHDDLHTADGAHACARVGVDSDHMARQGRRYGTYAMTAWMLQGLQALSPRQWPPLGAFIKLPALRVVHDLVASFAERYNLLKCEEKMLAEAAGTSLGCTSKTRSAPAHFLQHA